jgi:hypothetical protein
MDRLRMAVIAMALAAAALAGCLADRRIDRGDIIYPANYRGDLLAYMRVYLVDPTGIREAFVSEPVLRSVGSGTNYIACVRFNARGSNGQYLGAKTHRVIFLEGRLDRVAEATREQCADTAFQPFPELEKLQR